MVLRHLNFLLCLLWCLNFFAIQPLQAEDITPPQCEQKASAEAPALFKLVSENSAIDGQAPFWLALEVNLQKGWHSYWKNPGDSGMPLQIEWQLPENFKISKMHWPSPEKLDKGGLISYGYEDKATFLVEITPSGTVQSTSINIGANIRWLACSNMLCQPGEDVVTLEMPIAKACPNETHSALFEKARHALPVQAHVVQVHKNNGFIELELQIANSHQITTVQFFPEHKKIIDSSEETLLKSINDNSFRMSLKEHKSMQAEHLKGIAVLHTKDPSAKRSIEIDIPIKQASEALLAVAIPPLVTKNIIIDTQDNQADFDGGLGMAVMFAFLGGMLLNLMPCVLPVISFKILSFIKIAGEDRLKTFKHGLAFSFGVILSFWCLASLMLILQSYGQLVGWGFQLQEPIFIACLAALIFLVALNLFGVFEFGHSAVAMAGSLQSSSSKFSGFFASFCSGILATALATPCTGPFLGSAIGFAVTLPPVQSLLIFTSLGLGMAAPYLILSAYPQLMRFLPKPGPWMIAFKELMGFVMLATVLWLVWVFAAQTNSIATILMLAAFFLLSIAAWIFGRYCTPICSKTSRLFSGMLALAFMAAATYVLVGASSTSVINMAKEVSGHQDSSEMAWNEFSPQKMQTFQESKRPIFIDFTAKWCLICQANHLVLSTAEVQAKMAEKNVIMVKADWTRSDPEITKFLRRFGRNGVPLYLLYKGESDDRPQILPQVLTPEIVIEALNKI